MSKKRIPAYMREGGKVLTCPCCNRSADKKSLTRTLGRKMTFWNSEIVIAIEDLQNGYNKWACDLCYEEGRAILANPEKQLYCDESPYLSYCDQEKQCENCGKQFIFGKEEQRYWYEELNFWVQSVPKQCVECRKQIRYKKELNNELAQLLKNEDNLTAEELIRISDIYREIGNEQKSKMYMTRALNLKRKMGNDDNTPN